MIVQVSYLSNKTVVIVVVVVVVTLSVPFKDPDSEIGIT